jgi:hypothetical protein
MSEPKIDSYTEPEVVNRRFWRSIMLVVVLGSVFAAVFGNLKFTGGVVLGGLLAMLNYRWLLSSLRGILLIASPKAPPGTAMMFMFRWLVIAALGYTAYWLGHFSSTGIVMGLLAPAVAVLMEAGYLSYRLMAGIRELND